MLDVWLPKHVLLASPAEALSLDNLHGVIVVVNLFGGISLWDLVQSLPFDWSILSGKRGCIWSFITFYFICRYFAVVAVATTLMFVNVPRLSDSVVFACFNQITYLLSLGFSFSILTIKIVATWKQFHICWLMAISHGVLWGAILEECKLRFWPAPFAPPVMLTALCFYMSTVILILGVAGAIFSRRESGEERDFLSDCMQQGVHCFLPIWVSTTIYAVTSFVSANWALTFMTTYISYIVTVVFAARVYIDMIRHWKSCPVGQYCVVWKLCKSTYLNGVKYISLEVSTSAPTFAIGSGTFCPFSRQTNDASRSVPLDTFRV